MSYSREDPLENAFMVTPNPSDMIMHLKDLILGIINRNTDVTKLRLWKVNVSPNAKEKFDQIKIQQVV